QPAGGFEPVDVRHQHVEDNRIRLNLADVESVQRFGAVGGELDLVALEGKRAPQRLAYGCFVIDDEDLCAVHVRIVAGKIESELRASQGREAPAATPRPPGGRPRGRRSVQEPGKESHGVSLAGAPEKRLRGR